uniref:C2H2-type domain-containing protein n=1 Tax=Graphocephala atropunctata TaxID=36148 RepID=A0A1B6KF91_9HEMI
MFISGREETTSENPDMSLCSSSGVESTTYGEENKLMDFESDIDTWVIDKEDLNASPHAVLEKSRTDVRSTGLKITNKENIKKCSSLSDRKSLRCFRINKNWGYEGTISESEGDSKRISSGDGNDHSHWSKKQRIDSSNISSDDKMCMEPKLQNTSSSSSLSSLNTIMQDKEPLCSEEISLMLTDIDGSSDSYQVKARERLHSIENVSSIVESKDKVGDVVPSFLNLKLECSVCHFTCYSVEELKCHESTHKRTSLSMSHPERSPNQLQKNNLQTGSTWNRTDFLDNFKSHLISSGTKIPVHVNENISCCDENSIGGELKRSKNKPKFECGMCKFNCSELLIHKSHQILCHSDKNNLVCEYCNYQTSLCTNLANHIRVHFQIDCPHCDYQCSLKASLDAHVLRYHSEMRYLQCELCEYSCKSHGKFQKHLQLHKTTSKYQCEECKMFFTNKKSLKSHIRKHSIEKTTFKCTECELQFSQKYHLKVHMKCHEQLYVCDTCNRKFAKKTFLTVHMKVHSQEPLKCKKCNSVFSRKNYLKLHMRIHVPKYSKCEHCPFKSINPSDLSKHICINKLYDVQKRSLNFHKEDTINDKLSRTSSKKGRSNVASSIPNIDIKKKDKIREMKVGKPVVTKRSYKRKKLNKDKIRVLSLRQNLPSRKSQNFVENKSSTHDNVNSSSKIDPDFKEPANNVKRRKNVGLKIRNRIHSKKNNWVVDNRNVASLSSHKKIGKNLKKYQFHENWNLSKMLYGGKALSPKDLLVEPVRFTNENYVQCYYQSQQPTLQDHFDGHLRQNTLLSCRFCRYKTNSHQLLQRHTASNHSWDQAFLSALFS